LTVVDPRNKFQWFRNESMKTKLIAAGGAAALAGVAVLAAVRARTQPNSPATRTTVSVEQDGKASANAPSHPVDLIPIVHLQTQDKLVTVQSGPDGLVYLVQTKDGKVLHENLSEDQLKAQAPEIHELIKTAVAGSGSKDNSFLDARVSR
jgi:hypothetical protein